MKSTEQHYLINWDEQWATHAAGYHEGFVHIDLKDYDSECFSHSLLRLKPGPGFGDLSHPTTRLVLKLMGPIVKNKHVLDIGCGSGILSFAALAMGAASVDGIDIDEEALTHARSNSCYNGMEQAIHFTTPTRYCHSAKKHPLVILMNMIQCEQKQAWESLASIQDHVQIAITSGILAEGQEDYKLQSQLWGWELIQTKEEEGWMGFIFDLH